MVPTIIGRWTTKRNRLFVCYEMPSVLCRGVPRGTTVLSPISGVNPGPLNFPAPDSESWQPIRCGDNIRGMEDNNCEGTICKSDLHAQLSVGSPALSPCCPERLWGEGIDCARFALVALSGVGTASRRLSVARWWNDRRPFSRPTSHWLLCLVAQSRCLGQAQGHWPKRRWIMWIESGTNPQCRMVAELVDWCVPRR